MSESVQEENVQPNHRKLKKLYNKIKKQMEFYFSDSNLVKDKFLYDLISKDSDGFVEIDIFKKFNKIRALTSNSDVIAESLSKSDLFEISTDRKKVRRIAPLELLKDFDACTLYVEKLPPNADQKWVKDVFGQFGSITYVNVPRYKATNRIKGFAFVEFENPEGVKKACDFYKISSEKECTASEDDDKNVKTKKHRHEEAVSDKRNKKSKMRSISESSDKVPDHPSLKNEHSQETSEKNLESHQKNRRKRKRCCSESEIVLKKAKESTDEIQNIVKTEELVSENLGAGNNKASSDSQLEQPDIKSSEPSAHLEEQMATDEEKIEAPNTCINGTDTGVVKNKRRKKNSKKHRNSEKPILRVMPKSEWKAFRSKYLDLQRSTMKLLKKKILHEMHEFKEQESSTKPTDETKIPETKKTLQFMPGIIIKIKLSEPVKNTSEIKTHVKANAVVAYVDAPVESSEVFIRCHSSEDAQTILKEKKLSHLGEAQLIKDEEEKKYWEKIESDRKNKLNNPVIHKKRGRDKLLAKAAKLEEIKNKHIYFDD